MLNFKTWLGPMEGPCYLEVSEPSPTAAIIVTYEDKALILRRGPTAPWRPGEWNLPGGGIDPGEQPQEAAIRECEEEAGISPGNVKFFKKISDPKFTLYIFSGETQQNKPHLNYESDRFAWVSVDEIKKYRFVPYVAEAISMFLNQNLGSKSERPYPYS